MCAAAKFPAGLQARAAIQYITLSQNVSQVHRIRACEHLCKLRAVLLLLSVTGRHVKHCNVGLPHFPPYQHIENAPVVGFIGWQGVSRIAAKFKFSLMGSAVALWPLTCQAVVGAPPSQSSSLLASLLQCTGAGTTTYSSASHAMVLQIAEDTFQSRLPELSDV